MTDIIKALQDEIEAANQRRAALVSSLRIDGLLPPLKRYEHVELIGYIKGLQTAVDLLTKERARELQA